MLKRLALTVLVAAAALTVQPLAAYAAGGAATTATTADCGPVHPPVLMMATAGIGQGTASPCGDTSWGG